MARGRIHTNFKKRSTHNARLSNHFLSISILLIQCPVNVLFALIFKGIYYLKRIHGVYNTFWKKDDELQGQFRLFRCNACRNSGRGGHNVLLEANVKDT